MQIVESPMNMRIVAVVMTAALVTTSTGCGRMQNFLFGRGARCGLCNRMAPPPAPAMTQPPCGNPGHPPGGCQCVDPCQNSYQGTGTPSYGPSYRAPAGDCSTCDPYSSPVVGSAVSPGVVEGYGSQWYPAPTDSQGYRSNLPAYDQGYKVDKDGARILHEEPLPPGAMAVE